MYGGLGAFRRTVAIEAGDMVRERQTILHMPDVSRLQARALVEESRIHRVRKGQPAVVRVDAFPDRDFRGTVAEVSGRPEPTRWSRPDVTRFAVLVSIDNPAAGFRPGMTGMAEIDVSALERE